MTLPGFPSDVRIAEPDAESTQLLLFERGHWCVTCRKHLIQVAAAIDAFNRRRTEVVAVVHESLSDLRSAALRANYPFSIASDHDLAVSESLELVGIDEYGKRTIRPAAIIVRPDGDIAFSYVGDDSIDRLSVPALLLAIDRIA